MDYLEIPLDCISSTVPICPLCNDTKTVTIPSQTVILTPNPPYRTECSKCNIWWESYKEPHALYKCGRHNQSD